MVNNYDHLNNYWKVALESGESGFPTKRVIQQILKYMLNISVMLY